MTVCLINMAGFGGDVVNGNLEYLRGNNPWIYLFKLTS